MESIGTIEKWEREWESIFQRPVKHCAREVGCVVWLAASALARASAKVNFDWCVLSQSFKTIDPSSRSSRRHFKVSTKQNKTDAADAAAENKVLQLHKHAHRKKEKEERKTQSHSVEWVSGVLCFPCYSFLLLLPLLHYNFWHRVREFRDQRGLLSWCWCGRLKLLLLLQLPPLQVTCACEQGNLHASREWVKAQQQQQLKTS